MPWDKLPWMTSFFLSFCYSWAIENFTHIASYYHQKAKYDYKLEDEESGVRRWGYPKK